jgi:hypothetical protein
MGVLLRENTRVIGRERGALEATNETPMHGRRR